MRMRNIWFDGPSFLIALLMGGYVVFSIVDYLRNGNSSLVGTTLAISLFLLFAMVYSWMSLKIGDIQRRAQTARSTKAEMAKTERGDIGE
jgi:hypothetical protein